LGLTEASTLPDPSQQQLQAAREEAELTLKHLHLVQEELEVYCLKSEELSQALQQRDAQISELRQEVKKGRESITAIHSAQINKLTTQHQQQIQSLHQKLAKHLSQQKKIDQQHHTIQQLETELQQWKKRAKEVETYLDALNTSREQEKEQLSEQQAQLNQLHQELEQAKLNIPRSEELSKALNQRDEQISELHQQLDTIREQKQQQLSEKETHINRLLQDLDQANAYLPKYEELSESLHRHIAEITELRHHLDTSREQEQQLSEKDIQLNQLQQELQQARSYIPKSEQLTQALQQRDAKISEKDSQLNQLRQELEQANQNALDADARTDQLQKLLTTAQKMLEGQATYLQDLSKKEEEAEMAIERERQIMEEIIYLFENSRIAPGLDSSSIPRLRDLLQTKRSDSTRSR
jgi:chromosome segregation ATPase